MILEGKNIAVLGAGKSGVSAARLAASRGACVTVFDSGSKEHLASVLSSLAEYRIPIVVGDSALNAPPGIDCAVLSPGIAKDADIARAFSEDGCDLIGEIEFAWRLRSDIPAIAVTGTNGKTTTTELIASIINGAGLTTVACGNIGLPFSDVVRVNNPVDIMTIELSSFQLESIATFRPSVAVWMNFAPDHLDRYQSLDDYRSAKEEIFKYQTESDWCVIKKEEEDVLELSGRVVTFSAFTDSADYWYHDGLIWGPEKRCLLNYRDTGLHGLHNAENVMAAMAAARCVGVSFDDMIASVMKFRAPAHRSEIIGTRQGVTFVNDSKATNLHALESSLTGQESPVVLIAGGKKKGLDYSALRKLVKSNVKEVVCIGETAPELEAVWGDIVNCHVAEDLRSAVSVSYSLSASGDTVLFSPGTSSFDMFSGYEERGDSFREAVNALSLKESEASKFTNQQQPT